MVPIAAIETVVYAVLTNLSEFFYRHNRHELSFFRRLLQSSTFTLVWAFSMPSYLGFFSKKHLLGNLPTNESIAKQIHTLKRFPSAVDKDKFIRRNTLSTTGAFVKYCTKNDRIWKNLLEIFYIVPNHFDNILRALKDCHSFVKNKTLFTRTFTNMPQDTKDLFKHIPYLESLFIDLIEIALYGDVTVEDDKGDEDTCVISLMPMLDPVQDPTAKGTSRILYERENIEQWLKQNSCSPWTKLPLKISELLEMDDKYFQEKGRRRKKIAIDLNRALLASNLP